MAITIEQIRQRELERFYEDGLCPRCRSSYVEDSEGFPGETIFHCRECDYHWTDFDLSAVM